MTVRLHELEFGGHLQLDSSVDDTLHLIRARGRATLLEVPPGWASIWMSLGGALRVKSHEAAWDVAPRDLLIWHEGGLRNCGQKSAWFLTLCGPTTAWRAYTPMAHDVVSGPRSIFPAHSRCPREARRLFVHLARLVGRPDAKASLVDHFAAACCSAISENQGDMRDYLARCSGRTAKRRQHTLLRLLRVRHLIANNPDSRFDLLYLSRVANYSPWHLTRTYRDVFGETPAEHAARVRLKRAMELVHTSTLSVREITEALGFESQSTFCRSFKKAYGVTTTQARDCGSPYRTAAANNSLGT